MEKLYNKYKVYKYIYLILSNIDYFYNINPIFIVYQCCF